jgi:hypothetical protein
MQPQFSAYTSRIILSAHIRDLQRSMHPERSKRVRRRLTRIRKSS